MNFGLKKRDFYEMVSRGELVRIKRGVYQFFDYLPLSLDEQFSDVSKELNTRSAICLSSALSYYDLSDQIVTRPFVLVDATFYIKTDQCILFRKRNPKWDIGIEQKEGFKITSIERTIVESVYHKSHTGWDGIKALKYSIENKITTVTKVHEIAKKLGCEKKILPNLEVFI